jgi:chaperonin GroES
VPDLELKPLHDYVAIRRLKDVQVGSILVPDIVDTKPRLGIVEAIGPGRRLKDGSRAPMHVQVGDRVSFSLESGYVSGLPGRGPNDTRLLIHEVNIVAVLDPDIEASAVASPWPGYVVDGPQDSDHG